jgi:hypothetical protein
MAAPSRHTCAVTEAGRWPCSERRRGAAEDRPAAAGTGVKVGRFSEAKRRRGTRAEAKGGGGYGCRESWLCAGWAADRKVAHAVGGNHKDGFWVFDDVTRRLSRLEPLHAPAGRADGVVPGPAIGIARQGQDDRREQCDRRPEYRRHAGGAEAHGRLVEGASPYHGCLGMVKLFRSRCVKTYERYCFAAVSTG